MGPHEKVLGREIPAAAMWETNIPSIDIEDRGADFLVTVEAPGFNKKEIVCDLDLECDQAFRLNFKFT